MDRRRVGLVIPALNEARTIGPVVEHAARFGTPIVVDDGSVDATGAIARDAGAEVVRHDVNRGYDGAIGSGFQRASELGCEVVLTLDADGQHDPGLIRGFLDELERGAELVLGVRDRRQRFAEHLFALVTWLRWGIRDPLCGMKGYRIELFRALGHFDSYQSIGTELMIFGARRRCRMVQVPVPTRARADRPRFGRALSANQRILRALVRGMAGGAAPGAAEPDAAGRADPRGR